MIWLQFWYTEWVDFFKGMADFSLFLELHFLLLSLSTIMLFIWFIVPYFYIAEHLTRHGYTENDCSKLISLIGITNTIGMVSILTEISMLEARQVSDTSISTVHSNTSISRLAVIRRNHFRDDRDEPSYFLLRSFSYIRVSHLGYAKGDVPHPNCCLC